MTDHSRSIRNILLLLLVIALFFVLKVLSGLLIPLALAAMLTILNLPLINFLKKWRIPKALITILVAMLTIVIIWVIVWMISGTVEQIIQEQDALAAQFARRFDAAIIWIGDTIPAIDVEYIRDELNVDVIASSENIANFIGRLVGAIGDIGSFSIVFLIYYLVLISSANTYHEYVEYVKGSEGIGKAKNVWNLTQESISTYMSIKTVVSLATGIIMGVICWAFGLRFALFWGFLAFLMNYIPSIGSLVATVLPFLMAVVQFNSFVMVVALLFALGLSQFIIGNVVDPMLMGSRLRLNTVSIIFGLLFWGYIWGIPGMLLSVPLMVMIRLLLESHDDFVIIARVMGNPDKLVGKKPSLFTKIITRYETEVDHKQDKEG